MNPEATLLDGFPTAQAPFELGVLAALHQLIRPARTLEIGVWHGGTLWHWLQAAQTVVGVDDLMEHRQDWQQWAEDADADLALIHGRSDNPDVIEQAWAHGPYQFLFIDADHTYQAVKADYDVYREMVEPGGVIAFHDIKPRPEQGYGVDQLWDEIKNAPGARTIEIFQKEPYYSSGMNHGYPDGTVYEPGIGVVWV